MICKSNNKKHKAIISQFFLQIELFLYNKIRQKLVNYKNWHLRVRMVLLLSNTFSALSIFDWRFIVYQLHDQTRPTELTNRTKFDLVVYSTHTHTPFRILAHRFNCFYTVIYDESLWTIKNWYDTSRIIRVVFLSNIFSALGIF